MAAPHLPPSTTIHTQHAPQSSRPKPFPRRLAPVSASSSCLARRSLRQEISRDAASFPAACLASHPVCLTSPLVRIRGVCTLRDSLLACGAFEAEATPGETSVASRPSRRHVTQLIPLDNLPHRPPLGHLRRGIRTHARARTHTRTRPTTDSAGVRIQTSTQPIGNALIEFDTPPTPTHAPLDTRPPPPPPPPPPPRPPLCTLRPWRASKPLPSTRPTLILRRGPTLPWLCYSTTEW